MTQKAKQPKTGNRYTNVNMTAREAQTLNGCLRKMTNILEDMKNRGVWMLTTDRLEEGIQKIVESVVEGDRMEELSPSAIRNV